MGRTRTSPTTDYVAFIEHFRDVANKVPDEIVEQATLQTAPVAATA